MDVPQSHNPRKQNQNAQKPTHAYVIPYFKKDGEIFVLSGRERAVFEQAAKEIRPQNPAKLITLLNNKKRILNDSGQNTAHNIHRNFSGVLLAGRTALPGGRIEKGESAQTAAAREFTEEFGFAGVTPQHLTPFKKYPLDSRRHEAYFLLNLDTAKIDPETIIHHFRQNPTTEKRLLEILSPEALVEKLNAPDDSDKDFIRQEMIRFAAVFCRKLEALSSEKIPVSQEAEAKFAQDLYEYQIQRTFNAVNAAREFKIQYASKTSAKEQAPQFLLPPPKTLPTTNPPEKMAHVQNRK